MGANTNKKDDSLQSFSNGFQTHCGCLECYHPGAETLDYDYNAANQNGTSSSSKTQHPRIRERGEFYIDSFNDQPWSWSFGTNEMVCICGATCDRSACYVLYCAMHAIDWSFLIALFHCLAIFCRCLTIFLNYSTHLSLYLSGIHPSIHRTELGSICRIKLVPSCLAWYGYS
jgi:hypothetical protein